jgi:hypothetical protein
MRKIYLIVIKNNEGFNCLSKLSRREKDSFTADGTLEGLASYCFFITNSYVYSLFGVVIGAITIVAWYCKYRNIWHTKYKK